MRSNYSREERQKIVEEYIQSGKSQTVFAPEYGIKPNTLSAWVTKYKSAERSVKSWVMARRNFLFSGSGNGARASCFILSLIETAKQNGIAPEDYLRCLFEKAPYAETENDWEKLLPWNIEITPYKIRGEWI